MEPRAAINSTTAGVGLRTLSGGKRKKKRRDATNDHRIKIVAVGSVSQRPFFFGSERSWSIGSEIGSAWGGEK